eukprot:gene2417-1520_t
MSRKIITSSFHQPSSQSKTLFTYKNHPSKAKDHMASSQNENTAQHESSQYRGTTHAHQSNGTPNATPNNHYCKLRNKYNDYTISPPRSEVKPNVTHQKQQIIHQTRHPHIATLEHARAHKTYNSQVINRTLINADMLTHTPPKRQQIYKTQQQLQPILKQKRNSSNTTNLIPKSPIQSPSKPKPQGRYPICKSLASKQLQNKDLCQTSPLEFNTTNKLNENLTTPPKCHPQTLKPPTASHSTTYQFQTTINPPKEQTHPAKQNLKSHTQKHFTIQQHKGNTNKDVQTCNQNLFKTTLLLSHSTLLTHLHSAIKPTSNRPKSNKYQIPVTTELIINYNHRANISTYPPTRIRIPYQ